jgi:cell wall-associated NlpC family hydrolase
MSRQEGAPLISRNTGARAFIPAALAAAILFSIIPSTPAAATEIAPTPTETPAPTEAPTETPAPTEAPTEAPISIPTATITAAATAAIPSRTEAQQIIRIARAQLGDPWRYGASGPYAFDCSGLVRYAYRRAGDAAVIHTKTLRSARSLYLWFKAHGKASRTNPKVGDLVIWGRGTHVGIYIGKGKAISTLRSGVRIHGVYAVTARFTAYLHTGMSTRIATTAAPTN